MILFINVKFFKWFHECESKSICKPTWISVFSISYWSAELKWNNSGWLGFTICTKGRKKKKFTGCRKNPLLEIECR